MSLDTAVVLDANVLATFTVADLLLRLAEAPRAFRPFWSEAILEEVRRTHVHRLNWPPAVAESFGAAIRAHFPEAMVRGHEGMLARCDNDPKDRHVLACAIQARASVILTYNLSDFPNSALAPHGIRALHPAAFLREIRSRDAERVRQVLAKIAARRGLTEEALRRSLHVHLPGF